MEIIKEARKNSKYPYKVKYIDYQFFKDYSEIKYYSSIRPGKKVGDACVNNLSALRYSRDLPVQFQLNFDEDWQFLPVRKNNNSARIAKKCIMTICPLQKTNLITCSLLRPFIHSFIQHFFLFSKYGEYMLILFHIRMLMLHVCFFL